MATPELEFAPLNLLPNSGGRGASVQLLVEAMREMAVRSLARMYLADQRLFCFRLRRTPNDLLREGVSVRYTAIALLGLAAEHPDAWRRVLGGHSPSDVCEGLIERCARSTELGEVALCLWAARVWRVARVSILLDRLRSLDPVGGNHPTVETAWSLAALTVPGHGVVEGELTESLARLLIRSFKHGADLFSHWPAGSRRTNALRGHVTCFADWVYPVVALSYYHQVTGDREAAEVVQRAVARMKGLQGPAGQWWWHYDVRTGRVIEKYPVYAIHQDAMAPMALFAAQEACGIDCREAVLCSLAWLKHSPEISGTLVDEQHDVIWRKVARHEPGKLVRSMQAILSRIHPSLRAPAVDWIFLPGYVDYETRPYHMGWLLHAWSGERGSRLPTQPA